MLAGLGGYFAVIIRLRLEKSQKIDFIKTSLCDELNEICSVIEKMIETHRTSQNIPKVYFDELSENTQSYKQHKPTLFIIGDAPLRKRINDFYKRLETEIKTSQAAVGTLDPGSAQTGITSGVTSTFTTIKADALSIEVSIKKYKFYPLGLN